MKHAQSKDEHHNSGYGIYWVTWIALLGLTGITVTVAGMRLGNISVIVAMFIATIKVSIVLAFFMHLKYEKPLFQIIVYVVVAVLAVFFGLTFLDVLTR